MKLLLDEHFSDRIADQLRKKGCDAIAVSARSDLREMRDEDLLRWAAQDGRALFTENVKDFLPIHGRWLIHGEQHAGLILAAPRKFPRTVAGFGRLVTALADLLSERSGRTLLQSDVLWL